MRGKLFKHMFLVAMSVFVACTALFMWSLYSYFSEERQAEQKAETAYVAAAVEEGGPGRHSAVRQRGQGGGYGEPCRPR